MKAGRVGEIEAVEEDEREKDLFEDPFGKRIEGRCC